MLYVIKSSLSPLILWMKSRLSTLNVDERIGEDVVALLDNSASMNARMSEGGTATVRTFEQVESLKSWLESR